MLTYAIMTALFVRERTGVGQLVSSSILGSLISLQSHMLQAHLVTGQQPRDIPRTENRNPFWNIYRTIDDRWLCLTMPRSEEHWHNCCLAFNMEESENDPRFDTHEKRMENAKALISVLDQRFITKPLAEWVKRVEGTGIILAPVNEYADVAYDQQAWDNEYILEDTHPILGRMRVLGSPVYLSRTPAKRQCWAPELGQHTEEVLTEICGYSWDEVATLKDEGVIM
jgi:crotonobetainyl-CoA:carnitine CoA-transferase CaiB-like acyl-CoA transferase